MKSNDLNSFDKIIQSKLNQHQVEFNEGDWNSFEKKLNSSIKPFYKSKWFIGSAAVISTLIIATATILLSQNPTETSDKSSSKNAPEDARLIGLSKKVKANNISKINEIDQNENHQVDRISNSDTQELTISKVDVDTTPESNDIDKNQDIASIHKPESEKAPQEIEQDANNNIKSEEAKIIQPVSDFTCLNPDQCLGATYEFHSNNQDNVDYLWSFGDDQYSKEQNPSHQYKKAGSFKVSLIVRSSKDNSVLSKSKEVLIIVRELPKVNFATEEITQNGIPTISFINTTDQASNWIWSFGDGTTSSEKDPYKAYKRKGQYTVNLTAKNNLGCSNTTTKTVQIQDDYNLLAPNSFTPNGDGINDTFIPEALKSMDVEFTMTIYSQSQGLLFETKNINQQWDGINQQNGNTCGEGTYIWIVTLTNQDGQSEQYKGAVLLLK